MSSSFYRGSIRAIEPLLHFTGDFTLRVEVKNLSDELWTSAGPNPIRVAYHWLDEDWNMVVFDGQRTPLPEGGIAPGECQTVLAQVQAPKNSGTYRFMLTLVHEGVSWFENYDDFRYYLKCNIAKKENYRLALLGTPRSGNTWMHRMLSGLLDLKVIAVHRASDVNWDNLPERFILQLHSHADTKIIKKLNDFNIKKIVMRRHPFDVLISILHFCRHEPQTAQWLDSEYGDETEILNAIPIDSVFINYALSDRASSLLNLTHEWWGVPGTYTIKYESLVSEPLNQLKHLLDWLELSVPGDWIENIIQANSLQNLKQHQLSNNHFWQGKPNNWKKLLLPEHARLIHKKHDHLFERHGYLCDPDETLTAAAALENWTRLLILKT